MLNDPSDDTWQDICPSPSSNALDNGAQQAMRVSTDSSSTKPLITDTNCPVCQNSPGIPGHTLQQCLVVRHLRLRLPDTTPPPSPSFCPVTEYPPLSLPTAPMRSHEDSNEQGSISESIQRQVATVE